MELNETDKSYDIEFAGSAISDIVRQLIKEMKVVRLARTKGAESEKVNGGYVVKLRVTAVKKTPLVDLGKEIQKIVFEGVKLATNIELKKIDVHFNKLLEY